MGSSSDFSKVPEGSTWSPLRILLNIERKLFANSVEVNGDEVVSAWEEVT